MHTAFSKEDQIAFVDHNCRTAGIGCIECKEILFKNLIEEIGPIQARVREMNGKPGYIEEVLKTGAAKCKSISEKVMDEVRTKIGVKSEWLGQ